jgi:hypothetical protein
MLLRELTQPLEEKQVWARSGKQVVRKYRCVGGRRNGRVVAKISQCYAAPDLKKSKRLKVMKARLGTRLAKKTKKTKRVNPASRRVQQLNKSRK